MNIRLIIIAVVSVILLYLILKFGNRAIAVINEKKFLEQNKGLEQAASDKKQKASHNDVEFDALASKIYNAKGFWNDDEQSVEAVFQTMHNELDVSKLIKSFGIKDGMALAAFLYDFLNSTEIEQYVNKPLRGNGVNFSF